MIIEEFELIVNAIPSDERSEYPKAAKILEPWRSEVTHLPIHGVVRVHGNLDVRKTIKQIHFKVVRNHQQIRLYRRELWIGGDDALLHRLPVSESAAIPIAVLWLLSSPGFSLRIGKFPFPSGTFHFYENVLPFWCAHKILTHFSIQPLRVPQRDVRRAR